MEHTPGHDDGSGSDDDSGTRLYAESNLELDNAVNAGNGEADDVVESNDKSSDASVYQRPCSWIKQTEGTNAKAVESNDSADQDEQFSQSAKQVGIGQGDDDGAEEDDRFLQLDNFPNNDTAKDAISDSMADDAPKATEGSNPAIASATSSESLESNSNHH